MPHRKPRRSGTPKQCPHTPGTAAWGLHWACTRTWWVSPPWWRWRSRRSAYGRTRRRSPCHWTWVASLGRWGGHPWPCRSHRWHRRSRWGCGGWWHQCQRMGWRARSWWRTHSWRRGAAPPWPFCQAACRERAKALSNCLAKPSSWFSWKRALRLPPQSNSSWLRQFNPMQSLLEEYWYSWLRPSHLLPTRVKTKLFV